MVWLYSHALQTMGLFSTPYVVLGVILASKGCYACFGSPGGCPPSAVVVTGHGPVQGFDRVVEGQNVSTFFAIPFAEPPVGALRFHYPVPVAKAWTKVRPSWLPSSPCPGIVGKEGKEDCLYLNVYTPTKALLATSVPIDSSDPFKGEDYKGSLPVMQWLFGGGFVAGDAYQWSSKDSFTFDGARLAGRHDVVVVTSNYRLNVLGFNTYTVGPYGQTGTQAMEDQRMAMKWTHQNIALFGGDPARVTLFGESAGAFSTMYHLVSPPSWQYFSKAILQSATSQMEWFFQPKDEAAFLYESWAEKVGCSQNVSNNAWLACLQALPPWDFVHPPANFSGRSPLFPVFTVGPVVDGTTHGLLDVPSRLVQKGAFNKVPLLLGANEDGGSMFELLLTKIIPHGNILLPGWKTVSDLLSWTFSTEDHANITARYSSLEYIIPWGPFRYRKMIGRIMRDMTFMCSNRRLASAWHASGLSAYLYVFSFDFGILDNLAMIGAMHGFDINFVWRDTDMFHKMLFLGSGDLKGMADIMSCQWASFAHTGDPNGVNASIPGCGAVHGHVETWPQFGADRQYYLLKSSRWLPWGNPGVRAVRPNNRYPSDEFPSDEKCDMWDHVGYIWHGHNGSFRGSEGVSSGVERAVTTSAVVV